MENNSSHIVTVAENINEKKISETHMPQLQRRSSEKVKSSNKK
jgi:hypothetical protein